MAGSGPRRTKRTALLEEASRHINARGAGAISLNGIAAAVGLSRNALYYYVSDRADLVYRCYLRRCEFDAETLAAAVEVHDEAAARVASWIERSLCDGPASPVVIADRDFLPPEQRDAIRDLQDRNRDALRAVVADGIAQGGFRPVDIAVATDALIGMVNWTQLASPWLGHIDAQRTRRRAAAAITEVILQGVASDRAASVGCALDVGTLMPPLANAFDREAAARQKVEAVLATASALFNRRGIDGTSLEDIAAQLGATKGAVYYYFQDKAELVLRCYERAFDLYARILDIARELPDGLSRTAAVVHLNAQAQLGPLSPMMLQPGAASLPEATLASFVNTARRLRSVAASFLHEGANDGSCRPCDKTAISEVSAGAFLWLSKQHNDAQQTSTLYADRLADILCRGLIAA